MTQPNQNEKPPFVLSRTVAIGVAAILGLLIGAALWLVMAPDRTGPGVPGQVQSGVADIGGPFSLITHDDVAVTDKDFEGRYKFIYFGYTFCPDVCPLGLLFMQDVLTQLGADGDAITPLFISIDPERDSPAVLKDYIASFHPRLIGLTGTPEAVADVAAAYKMYYGKAPVADGGTSKAGDYGIDHMNIFYLMGPDGAYLAHFISPTSPKETAARIRKHLK